jgi:hypothetical protein
LKYPPPGPVFLLGLAFPSVGVCVESPAPAGLFPLALVSHET